MLVFIAFQGIRKFSLTTKMKKKISLIIVVVKEFFINNLIFKRYRVRERERLKMF